MPDIRNPHIAVEEIFAEPDLGYGTTKGTVPTLAITVTYEVFLTGMERRLPSLRFGFRERIVVKGTKARLSFEFLPVLEVEGEGPLLLPREVTRLVEKKFITDDLGVLGSIPITCTITLAPEPDPRQTLDTNTVTLPGVQFRSTVAVAQIANAVFWIRDQLFGRMSPDRDG